jgi:hypothetical protein
VVTAVLAILVLVAGGLAGVALDRGNRLDRQLNIAIAGSLGEEALARSTEPGSTEPGCVIVSGLIVDLHCCVD